jgi:hypothetical protein
MALKLSPGGTETVLYSFILSSSLANEPSQRRR